MSESGASKHSKPSTGRIAVAVVEDDPHFSLFLEAMLETSPRHRLVAVADCAQAMLAWDRQLQPHVILVDVRLPDRSGATLVKTLVERYPGALVLMLTAEDGESPVLTALRGGAVGYVLKGGKEEDILAAIDDALAGGAPMSPAIARKVLRSMQQAAEAGIPDGADRRLASLNERESTILRRVAEGALDKEVAAELGLAHSTVKNTLLAIYRKWQVRSRTEAAVMYTRMKEGRG